MALLAPSIMSTTTCLQLDAPTEPTTFHRYIITDDEPVSPKSSSIEEEQQLSPLQTEARQSALLLKGAREQYTLVDDHSIPEVLHKGEILVKVSIIVLVLELC